MVDVSLSDGRERAEMHFCFCVQANAWRSVLLASCKWWRLQEGPHALCYTLYLISVSKGGGSCPCHAACCKVSSKMQVRHVEGEGDLLKKTQHMPHLPLAYSVILARSQHQDECICRVCQDHMHAGWRRHAAVKSSSRLLGPSSLAKASWFLDVPFVPFRSWRWLRSSSCLASCQSLVNTADLLTAPFSLDLGVLRL